MKILLVVVALWGCGHEFGPAPVLRQKAQSCDDTCHGCCDERGQCRCGGGQVCVRTRCADPVDEGLF